MGPIHKFSISIWVRNFDFYDEIVVFHDEIRVLFRKSWLFRPHFWNNGVCIPIYCCSLNSFLFWTGLFLLHFSLILVQIWIQILPFFSIFVCFEHPYWLIFPFCTFFCRNWIVFDRLLIKKTSYYTHISPFPIKYWTILTSARSWQQWKIAL